MSNTKPTITSSKEGKGLTKLEVMEETFGSEERRVDSVTIDEVQVRLVDSVAVVTGRTVAEGSYRGQSVKVVLRFTDVCVNRGGQWQVVCSQGTPVGF
jgi:uncharacterized protein DUF4440